MDATTWLERAAQANQELIAGLKPADLTRPTPCWGWDVQALINHMIGVNYFFVGALGGQTPVAGEPPDYIGQDAAAAHAESVRAALAAWRAPEAMTKSIPFGQNALPAALAVRFHLSDHVLHQWDLAKAVGREPTLDPDLVAAADATLRANLQPAFRGPGQGFGYEIACPDTASTLEKLVAFSGRQP